MSEYHPDSWKIIVIESKEHGKIYKVLASWYGGFARGDSWKISSGIEDVKLADELYTMPQYSGSVYICHKNNEHISGIMGGVFSSYAKQAAESDGLFTISMVDMADFLETRK